MTLRTWIERTGPKTVAAKMNVDPSTVALWRAGKCCPRPRHMIGIHRLSKGQVSYESIVKHFVGRSR